MEGGIDIDFYDPSIHFFGGRRAIPTTLPSIHLAHTAHMYCLGSRTDWPVRSLLQAIVGIERPIFNILMPILVYEIKNFLNGGC